MRRIHELTYLTCILTQIWTATTFWSFTGSIYSSTFLVFPVIPSSSGSARVSPFAQTTAEDCAPATHRRLAGPEGNDLRLAANYRSVASPFTAMIGVYLGLQSSWAKLTKSLQAWSGHAPECDPPRGELDCRLHAVALPGPAEGPAEKRLRGFICHNCYS